MSLVDLVYKDCEVRVENVFMFVDLVLLSLDELDVILGMNFLTKYYATLDYSNKEVVFRKQGEFEVKFVGEKKVNLTNMISIFKARKLINKGCNAYLPHIMDTGMVRKDPKSVPIICEYLDLFSEELSGLSSDKGLSLLLRLR